MNACTASKQAKSNTICTKLIQSNDLGHSNIYLHISWLLLNAFTAAAAAAAANDDVFFQFTLANDDTDKHTLLNIGAILQSYDRILF